MTLEQAQIYGAGVANKSGSSVLVYRTTKGDHGVAFTLPGSTNVRVGERIYPTNPAVSFSGLAIAPAVAAVGYTAEDIFSLSAAELERVTAELYQRTV